MITQLEYLDVNIDSDENEFLKIEILVGEDAISLFNNESFLNDWEQLYNSCPWSTIFQSREFVLPWYNLPSSKDGAIVVMAEINQQLVGLITLTKLEDKKLILGAGCGGAEYQTWLAIPEYCESFIKASLYKLKVIFPRYNINFYNVPAETPLTWVVNDKYWRQQCILESLRRPLMDLRNPDIYKLFRKKHFREKLNRLKRLGKVEFEKVIDTSFFASILDELTEQSDFRKGAKFNNIEYREVPDRKRFLLDLHAQGILHTTILKLNGEIIASIAGAKGKNWVHLSGINTHSPIYSRYSPGLVNFTLLGKLLLEEGIHVFDLTPGGDAYKDRLATSHDQVYNLFVSTKLKTHFNRNLINPILNFLKSILKKRGFTPKHLKFEAKKFKNRLVLAFQRNQKDLLSWHYINTGLPLRHVIFKMDSNTQILQVKEQVKLNNISDLLNYKQNHGSQTKWDFLSEAMGRFEAEEQCYSISEDGNLLFCAWFNTKSIKEKIGFTTTQNPLILEVLYCNKNSQKRLESFINSSVAAIKKENFYTEEIYCLVRKRDQSLIQAFKILNVKPILLM